MKKINPFCVLVFCMVFCVLLLRAEAAEINLEGEWLFKIGDDSAWAEKDFDDKDWKVIKVPVTWEEAGYPDYDGIAWYRKHFTVPEEFAGKELTLTMGGVDDVDITYLNGTQIGTTSKWNTKREYPLPGILSKKGEDNVIAVRVDDTGGGGGIWQGPVSIRGARFEEIFPVEVKYLPPVEGDKGKVNLKFSNIGTMLMKDVSVKYEILDAVRKEIVSGEEIISVPAGKSVTKDIEVLQGQNNQIKVHLAISKKDGEKIQIKKLLVTGLNKLPSTPGADHIWLHVDGRYIKTSPYADPGNEIFMPVGVDWAQMYGGIREDWDWTAQWCKDNGMNMMRISFITLPYPMSRDTYYNFGVGGKDIEEIIPAHLAPLVEVLKNHKLYCYLDQHEYFSRIKPGAKTEYDRSGANPWRGEDYQIWTDHWVAIADYFKDEPWVMGYELCNEPVGISGGTCRKQYTNCIKAIRRVDTRHIILVGNNMWSHARSLEPTWNAVKFRPDEPYNQVVFTFHEYTHCDDIYAVSTKEYVPGRMQGVAGVEPVSNIIERVQNRHNVPIFCTEFGCAETGVKNLTDSEKQQFERDMINFCYERKMGWAIWLMQGYYINGNWGESGLSDTSAYFDVWQPLAKKQGSPIPKPGKLVPKANKIVCTVNTDKVAFNGTATVTAVVCDEYGWRVEEAANKVSFEVTSKKPGMAEIEGNKTVSAENGKVRINIKAGSVKGKVTVKASSEGLAPFELTLRIVKK